MHTRYGIEGTISDFDDDKTDDILSVLSALIENDDNIELNEDEINILYCETETQLTSEEWANKIMANVQQANGGHCFVEISVFLVEQTPIEVYSTETPEDEDEDSEGEE